MLGLSPDTTYRITAEVEDADGLKRVSAPWEWRTPPLPEGFPPLHVTVSRPQLMEPGVTLIPCNRWPGRGDLDREFGELASRASRLRGNAEGWVGPLSTDDASQQAFFMEMLGTLSAEWASVRNRISG